MKKVFTFAAAILFAAGINAQTITFGEGSTGAQTYGEDDFTLTVAGWDGSHSATSGRYFGTIEDNAKVIGMIASGGKLDGTSRSLVINSTYSGTLELYVCSSSSSAEREVTIGAQTKNTSKNSYTPEGSESARDVYGILAFDIKYGTSQVTTNGAIYIYKAVFTSNGESAPAPRDTIASYIQGPEVGTFTLTATDDSKASLAFSTKYNANKTVCTAITFGSSIVVTDHVPTDYFVKVVPAEGGFEAGDVIDFQPFTTMSTSDYTGTKRANLRIYAGSDTNASQIFETAATETDKTDVTDGHEVAGDVKVHTYTLTADCDALYFGRSGNTRLNVLSFIVTRAKADQPTAIEAIEDAPKAVKVIENGQIVIIRDGIRFDITGRKL